MKDKNKLSDTPIDSQSPDKSRRKAIIGTITGVTAATVWAKPIVDTVILPAHAATTDDTDSGSEGDLITSYYSAGGGGQNGAVDSNFSPLDIIVPPAHAGKGGGVTSFGPAKATSLGGGNWRVDIRNNANSLTRGGTLNEGGSLAQLQPYEGITGDCGHFSEAGTWATKITQISDTEIWVDVDGHGYVVLPASTQNLPSLDDICMDT